MSPAEKSTKDCEDSNTQRKLELAKLFDAAGLLNELAEFLNILEFPCAAYHERLLNDKK